MIDRILEDREKRYEKILNELKKGAKSVICGKINCPGTNKNTRESLKAFEYLCDILKETIIDCEYEVIDGCDGRSIIAAEKKDADELKIKTVQIEENHPLGRVFDIDVYNSEGVPVSRTDIGMSCRRCIVCGENAKICVRSQAHSMEKTIDAFNKIIYRYEEENGKK